MSEIQQENIPPRSLFAEPKKKIIAGIAAVLLLVVILLVTGVVGPGVKKTTKSIDPRPAPRNAYDIAILEARKWQTDAMLAAMNSGPVGETGHSGVWKLIFTSKSVKKKALVVEVADYKVVSTQEIPFAAPAADFPADIISQEEAIEKVHKIPGYEKESVLGIEAVYDPVAKVWYWGVRTPKGVVSVEAKKK